MTCPNCEKLLDILKAIATYGTDEEDGYPVEIVYDEYDEFAYKRIVDSYRDAAKKALTQPKEESK
jgi:hypothetical protein